MKKTILSAAILLAFSLCFPVKIHAIACSSDSVVDGNTLNNTVSIVEDSSANGNAGTPTGTTITASGKYGAARSFDGSNDVVNIGNPSSLQITGNLTISLWVYPTNIAEARENPIDKAYCGEFALTQETDGRLSYYHGPNGGETAGYMSCHWGNIFSNNTWVHIVIVRDVSAQSIKLYKNGVDQGTGCGSWVNPGRIDDVRIYNYARTEDQIKEDMNDSPITGAAPVGWWKMDDGYTTGVDNGNVTIASGKTLTINSGETFVWNPGKSITVGGGYIALSGRMKQSYLWLKDEDGDGYPASGSIPRYTDLTPSDGVRYYLASSTDCDDSNASVTGGSTYYQDSDGDGYGNPSVSTQACSQPGGYVSNNSDCYDANANAKPGQTSCFTTHRGDGSFDYDCSGSASACNSCSTSRSSATYYWRQCSGGYCWTDPYNQTFTGWTCSGSTSSCGATGYTCSSSKKASGCIYNPCSLYDYKSTSTSSCTVSCR